MDNNEKETNDKDNSPSEQSAIKGVLKADLKKMTMWYVIFYLVTDALMCSIFVLSWNMITGVMLPIVGVFGVMMFVCHFANKCFNYLYR